MACHSRLTASDVNEGLREKRILRARRLMCFILRRGKCCLDLVPTKVTVCTLLRPDDVDPSIMEQLDEREIMLVVSE